MADKKTPEEIEREALVKDREEAEAAAAKRGAGPVPVADKARLDKQFAERQAAEAARADEGSSRPSVDERLTPAEQKKAAKGDDA